ncbi:Diphthamide biosynthesis protein 4 [Cladophialophora chaetospira]|uniref:Diphthamide biosynthesis protein 4 n=1 Tax=Cladophialophora chaetospira TaxID=386627 RepID=A0AA38X408_9EURO|nr:Diphthamide biosynthesis protein 4 [Cladophialophora chaetospira]
MSSALRPQTHYDVLQLQRHEISGLSEADIKAAYRRALLLHHPDKAPTAKAEDAWSAHLQPGPNPRHTVDEIVIAFETLVDPTKRAEYDKSLEKDSASWRHVNGYKGTHIGVESFDLEELTYDEMMNTWSKGCRCGDQQGYVVTEPDLEQESQHGEIYVGCRGCSLFINVHFAVEEL